ASTGNFSVSGVRRALEPCTISTICPWPAPTVSTATKLRPVPTSRSRDCGSTRSGSTIRSLCPVMDATFCVATTTPGTRARNIASRLLQTGVDLGEDFVVARKTSLVPFAEDEIAVDGNVKDAAVAALRFGLDLRAVRLLDRGLQTEGELAIPSGRAIRDVD